MVFNAIPGAHSLAALTFCASRTPLPRSLAGGLAFISAPGVCTICARPPSMASGRRSARRLTEAPRENCPPPPINGTPTSGRASSAVPQCSIPHSRHVTTSPGPATVPTDSVACADIIGPTTSIGASGNSSCARIRAVSASLSPPGRPRPCLPRSPRYDRDRVRRLDSG